MRATHLLAVGLATAATPTTGRTKTFRPEEAFPSPGAPRPGEHTAVRAPSADRWTFTW